MNRSQFVASSLAQFLADRGFYLDFQCGQWKRMRTEDGKFLTYNPDPNGVPRFGLSVPGSFGVDFWIKEVGLSLPIPPGIECVNMRGTPVDARKFGFPDWTHAFYKDVCLGDLPFWSEHGIGGFILRASPTRGSEVLLRSALTPMVFFGGLELAWKDGRVLTIKGAKLPTLLTPEGVRTLGQATEIEVHPYALHLMDRNRGGNYDGFFSLLPAGKVEVSELEHAH